MMVFGISRVNSAININLPVNGQEGAPRQRGYQLAQLLLPPLAKQLTSMPGNYAAN